MLLTNQKGQHKFEKAPEGWTECGLMLAPYTLSGHNLCPSASTEKTKPNLEHCLEALARGFTVSVPFMVLPETWKGFPVFDGDEHDLWFLKKPGVSGLSFKGHRDPTLGCSHYCINMTGRGKFLRVQEARIRKSRALVQAHDWFMGELVDELRAALLSAEMRGLRLCVRLNTLSDVAWEAKKYWIEGTSVFDMFPRVQFMDYTKIWRRMVRYMDGKMPPNYVLCFSYNKVVTL